jgi:zinc transport system substrate-binding protein
MAACGAAPRRRQPRWWRPARWRRLPTWRRLATWWRLAAALAVACLSIAAALAPAHTAGAAAAAGTASWVAAAATTAGSVTAAGGAAASTAAIAAGTGPVAAAAPLQVTVSIPPAAFFVERIGGARVRVQAMVPPGVEEETYAPTPRQVADLLRSRLYVAVGHPAFPLESRYLLPLLAAHPEVRLVALSRGVQRIPMAGMAATPPAAAAAAQGSGRANAGGAASGVAAGATDPHIWLAPGPVGIAARNIAGGLAAVDPGNRAAYEQGLAGFQRDLLALDAAFRRAAASPRPVRFLSYHPAWGYLAHQYGFQQLVVENGGKDPGTASLVALVAAARRDGVRLLLVPPGLPARTTASLAAATGARVLAVDYLAHDWLAMMRNLAAALQEAGRP